jgi:hypothetical protein
MQGSCGPVACVVFVVLWIASLDLRRPSTACVTVSRGGRGRPDPSGCGGEHGGGEETHEKTRGRKEFLWGRGRCWGGGGGFVGGQRQVRVARARDRDDFKLLRGTRHCRRQAGSAVEVRETVHSGHGFAVPGHAVDNVPPLDASTAHAAFSAVCNAPSTQPDVHAQQSPAMYTPVSFAVPARW